MLDLHVQFVTNAEGQRVGVFIDLETYEQLLEALEELDDIEAFDKAMAEHSEVIPFDQAIAEIERDRPAE